MPLVTKQALGRRLRELRHRRKLTQERLAELVDLSADAIGRLERGTFSPSFDTMVKIADGLGIPIVELLRDEYDMSDDLATMIRGLPEQHRQIACAVVVTLRVQAALDCFADDHASGSA